MTRKLRTALGVSLAIGMTGGLLAPAAWSQTTQPPAKSPLQRNKTKLKPPSDSKLPPTPAPSSSAPSGTKPAATPQEEARTNAALADAQRLRDQARAALVSQLPIGDQIWLNTGDDLQFQLPGTTAQVSRIYTLNGAPTRAQATQNVVDALRNGERATTNEDLQRMVGGSQADLAAARQKYLQDGFQEVRVADGAVTFVKSSNPCQASTVASMVQGRVSETMYQSWRDDWDTRYPGQNEWTYSDARGRCPTCAGGCCSSSSGGGMVGAPVNALDAFILKGTLQPEQDLSDNAKAELEMTEVERAENALRQGNLDLATERFDTYLKRNPEDAGALRSFGFVLLQGKRLPEAITKITAAYRFEPVLAASPIDLSLIENGPALTTAALQRVVPVANRSPGYDASLVSAVLMQAQGRTKEAARMLQKARDKGLPDAISREFDLSLADATPDKPAAPASPKK